MDYGSLCGWYRHMAGVAWAAHLAGVMRVGLLASRAVQAAFEDACLHHGVVGTSGGGLRAPTHMAGERCSACAVRVAVLVASAAGMVALGDECWLGAVPTTKDSGSFFQ